VEAHGLHDRKIVRHEGAEPEIRFPFKAVPRVLPYWHDGKLRVGSWGACSRQCPLPTGGWVKVVDLDKPLWQALHPAIVDIPACFALDGDIWLQVREGIRGVLVHDGDQPHVYVLLEPATHYYQTMTRSAWMPVLLGEVI
jgi:hypothetical protein